MGLLQTLSISLHCLWRVSCLHPATCNDAALQPNQGISVKERERWVGRVHQDWWMENNESQNVDIHYGVCFLKHACYLRLECL